MQSNLIFNTYFMVCSLNFTSVYLYTYDWLYNDLKRGFAMFAMFKSRFIMTMVLLAVLLAARPAIAQRTAQRNNGYKHTFKFATLAPNGIGWAVHIQQLILPMIEDLSDGEVRVKVFWGGVMGDDEDVLKKMNAGLLNGAGLSAQGVTLAIPELTVLELPFMFNNYGEVDHIKKTMAKKFDALADKHGFLIIGLIDQDFDQIYSIHHDMTRLEHFKEAKFVTWFGPLEEHMLQTLGAETVSTDVPNISSTIRKGLADASVGPAIWQVGAQLHSVWKYVNTAKIRYSPALILQNASDYQGSQDVMELKELLLDNRNQLTLEFTTRVRADNEKCLKAMIEYGVKESELDKAHLEELKRVSRPVWHDMTGKFYSQNLLEEVIQRLEEYRAAN